jgi:hypothetical protein
MCEFGALRRFERLKCYEKLIFRCFFAAIMAVFSLITAIKAIKVEQKSPRFLWRFIA